MAIDTQDIDFNNEQAEEVSTESTNEESQATEVSGDEKKHQETDEAKYARLTRQADRLAKKLGLESEKSNKSSRANDLDYAQKAFLVANGLKDSKEMDLVKTFIKETGKSIEDVLESKYFQAELEEVRELSRTAKAIPSTSKRSTQSSQDSVDYWIAKGELPSDRELATKVVRERIRREKANSVFG